MSCNIETEKSYTDAAAGGSAVPVLAGSFRLLLGLIMAFAGLYIGTLSAIQGHALGLLMVLGSPFVIFKDGK